MFDADNANHIGIKGLRFFVILLPLLFLFSCNQNLTGYLRFSVSDGMVERMSAVSRNGDECNDDLYFEVSLSGGWKATGSFEMEKGAEVVFDSIPVGTKVYAEVYVYRNGMYDAQGVLISPKRVNLYYGKSDEIIIEDGENELKLALKEVRPDDNQEPADMQGFVYVPGTTITGSIDRSRLFVEGSTFTIPNMYVCDHEVTQGEYKKYCEYNRTEGDETIWQPTETYGKGDNYPAYYVSWYDAIVYCNKRSIADNLTPCYTINGKTNPDKWGAVPTGIDDDDWKTITCDFGANGYRLPTEAEWEYLARGGNVTNDGQTDYSGSNDIGEVAWYSGTDAGDYGLHPKEQKLPNDLDLYDMSGNVWEWCWDSGTNTDDSENRILRGGAWDEGAEQATVFYRGKSAYPTEVYFDIGFRVVRTVQ